MAEQTKSCPNCKAAQAKINQLEQKLSKRKVAVEKLQKAFAKVQKDNKLLSLDVENLKECCDLFDDDTTIEEQTLAKKRTND